MTATTVALDSGRLTAPQRRIGLTAMGGVAWTAGGATAIGVTLLLFKISGGTDP